MNRRDFIKTSAVAGTAIAMYAGFGSERAYAFYQSPGLQKYIQPLRGVYPLDPNGIPLALPDAFSTASVDHYSLVAGQYTDQLHPALGPTKLWGYADAAHGGLHRHLGGIIVAQKGKPVQITMTNNLPATHIIPMDTTIPGANQAQNRTAVHLHGGLVPWISDGGPHDWFAPDGTHGLSFLNNSVAYPAGPTTWAPGQAEYFYPNNQSARLVWYHDHAWGITRINAYAGVASAYVIRDTALESSAGLPIIERPDLPGGGREVPLVFQDKVFVGPNLAAVDPTWPASCPNTPGSLWYAHTYEHPRWALKNGLLLPDPSVVPEFFGDTMLCNGTVYPTVKLEQRRYRFRILNACNARFLSMNLYIRDASLDGMTLNNKGLVTNPAGPAITMIGSEGGFLPAPVTLNAPPVSFPGVAQTLPNQFLVAPAERADVLIDFSALPVGTKLILYNDAPAPFPGGKVYNDYFFGNQQSPVVTQAGFGPDTRQLLQIEVVAPGPSSPPDPPLSLDRLSPDPTLLAPLGVTTPPPGVPVRDLTLNEVADAYGRLIQLLGTTSRAPGGGFGKAYMDAPTEVVRAGSTEVWRILNTTADTHPIHFHLVNVQILSRQPFQVTSFTGVPNFQGPAVPPSPNEQGWKETVRMNPGECTTVIMKFDLPAVPFAVPTSPRTGGAEYVWHCHILEHEEHDMMRPLIVI
jgi:spore coat protein A, manganese oxidase